MLAPGTRLGPYEIVNSLGAGGMGEVYHARDTRLERGVAIKILPGPLTDNDRLRRFEQEARSASALNHPNIVTIYELGRHDSTHYIAMELVKGKTLRQLLTPGPLPARKAIEIATQIAEGLSKAHEAGITHRDLKPENVMISDDGFVKILDFGLAKLTRPSGEEANNFTTLGAHTQPGLIMGTLHYMSPEQACGGPLDFRSDQFSFGLVAYEMVTGRRAFSRDTAAETIAAILREQPEAIAARNPNAPAPLCWAIDRCLAKEPDKRYGSTRDLARDLAAIRDRFSEKSPKQVETRPANLPAQRTGLVGRHKEVSAAKDLLQREGVRLVTVTGPGGIGKTRLAVQVASELAESFPGGTYFVPLSAVSNPDLVAAVIVQNLGIREAGAKPPLEILKEHLQQSSHAATLIVLDNFEHLMAAAPTVAQLLTMGANLKILVTSRAALHLYGEHEFSVPALALPDPRSLPPLDDLLQYSAVALFVERAIAARPDFELTKENAFDVAEICARLDGLPLAIELAAARTKVLSPASMQTRLASRLQLLTGGARDLPLRQQTLRAAIDWSYDLLNPAEQRLFQRLSVFVGGCTLEAVEAVCDTKGDLELDLLDGMASMVDKSLVQQVEPARGESRFVMLHTIREYAREKLEASGEMAATKRAHAAYFLVLAEEETQGPEGAWRESFTIEQDNFRAALEWLTETADLDWGLRLGAALFRFWEAGEFLTEGRTRLGKLLKLAGDAEPTKAGARAFFAAGVLAGEQRDYNAANALLRKSLEISRQLHELRGVAVCLNALAVQARECGEMPVARSLFEEGLVMWRELGDRQAEARSLSNLASVVKMQGDYACANSIYQDSLAIFQELGDRVGVAWSLNYQGDAARDQGQVANARAFYEQGLAIFRELGDRWGIAGTLADLGNLAREERNYASAHSLYRESIRNFHQLEHKRGIARVLECFACSMAAQCEAERSLRMAGAAAALRENIGAPLSLAEQAKLDASLDSARQALSNTAGTTAWLEGWSMPLEKAVEEVLLPEAAPSSC